MATFKIPEGYEIKTTNEDGSILIGLIDYEKLIAEFYDTNKINHEKALEFFKIPINRKKFIESKTDFNKFVLIIYNRVPNYTEIILELMNQKKLSFGRLYNLLMYKELRCPIAEFIHKSTLFVFPDILIAKRLIYYDDLESFKIFKSRFSKVDLLDEIEKFNAKNILEWYLDEYSHKIKSMQIAKLICKSTNCSNEFHDVIKKYINEKKISDQVFSLFTKLAKETSEFDGAMIAAMEIYSVQEYL